MPESVTSSTPGEEPDAATLQQEMRDIDREIETRLAALNC